MNLAIPLDVYSPAQLSELIIELQDYLAGIRSNNQNAAPATVAGFLAENSVDTADASAIESVTKDAQMLLDKAPTVHILLANVPNRTQQREFTTWFRTQISPQVLLTFAARGDIGGGAIVQAGSNVYDFSFRKSILGNKARLTEIASV